MKLVGHTSITTTMNIYTHLSEAQMQKTAAKLEISSGKWIQTHYCEHPQKPLEIRHFAAVA